MKRIVIAIFLFLIFSLVLYNYQLVTNKNEYLSDKYLSNGCNWQVKLALNLGADPTYKDFEVFEFMGMKQQFICLRRFSEAVPKSQYERIDELLDKYRKPKFIEERWEGIKKSKK